MATEIASAYIALYTQMPGVANDIKKSLGGASVKASASASGKSIGAVMFGAFAGIAQSLTTKAFGAISSSLSGAISRVDIMNNYPKIMQNLGYSSQDASKSIATMSDKLQGLPTSLDAMAGVVQQLAPLTGGLGEATDLSLALNNALLAGGKSADIQANALEQYSQMLGNGVPDIAAWRSMVAAMPGQMNQLAQSMLGANKKQGDLYEAMKTGKVSFADFNRAILKLNEDGFGKYASFAQQAKDSTDGIATSQANLSTAITRNLASVIQKLKPQISGLLSGLTAAVNAAGPVVLSAIDGIGEAFSWIGKNLDWITPAAIGIGVLAAGFTVMNAAATVAAAGGLAKWIAATKVGASVQAAFNIVMNANPIMLVVTAIAALVAGLVYFFTQTEVGRQVWATFTQAVGAAAQWLWGAVLKPVVDAIGAAFNWLWTSVIQPVATFIGDAIKVVGQIATWLWSNAIKPAVDGIVGVFNFAWGVLRPIFDLWVAVIKVVGAVIVWLWNNAVVPAAKGIGKIVSWLWTNAVQPVFGWIGDKVQVVGKAFQLLYRGFVKPAFDAIGAVFKWIWNSIVKPIFSKIGDAVKAVGKAIGTAFKVAADAIRNAFNGVVGFVKGVFNGIIGAVNGVIRGINGVAGVVGDALGLDLHISTIPMLAKGGTITRAGSVIVGENGPELLNLPAGAQVVPDYDRSVTRVNGRSGLGGDTYIFHQTLVPERGIPMSVQLDNLARHARAGGLQRSLVKAVSA